MNTEFHAIPALIDSAFQQHAGAAKKRLCRVLNIRDGFEVRNVFPNSV
jgi:hypothetical protein